MAKRVKKEEKDAKKIKNEASLEAQEQLVEILNDSPHLVSLADTTYEVRSLRFGTQYLIAQEVININKAESATYGDIVKQFAVNIPSVVKVITLCLLNDKNKIFKDGVERNGFSDEYHALYDTLMWEGNIQQYTNLLLECLQMLDVSAFFQALDIVQIFRANVTMKKNQMDEQR
jgi:hypothetical protein